MASTIPSTSVVRVSEGRFDPARFAEVDRMTHDTGLFLIPAIERLPGLIKYFACVSPLGSVVHVSIWDSEEHAKQLSHLKEMIVDARREAEAVGVTFEPIVNFPISWAIF